MWAIALQMLIGDRTKYVSIIVGITFAALIMTQQPSIFVGLMTRTFGFITTVSQPDIWVMDPSVDFVEENKPLRDTDLLRVRGVPGIAWAVPLHKSLLTVQLPDGSRKSADLTGLDDATLIGAPGLMLRGELRDLRQADAIIVDDTAASRRLRYRGPDGQMRNLAVGDVLEINDRRAVVVGIAKAAPTFTTQPGIFTTYTRSIAYTPPQRRSLSYILVKAQPGQAVDALAARIAASTGLAAYSADRFKDVNLGYWMRNTGIPINFGISVALGFLVGAAIAGQTFFNFVHENSRQFAALKAMGAGNRTLIGMILLQALTVGGIGYGLGVGVAALFGWSMRGSVLAFRMVPEILLFSAAGVVLIICLAALISIRRVLRLEPAIVFK